MSYIKVYDVAVGRLFLSPRYIDIISAVYADIMTGVLRMGLQLMQYTYTSILYIYMYDK